MKPSIQAGLLFVLLAYAGGLQAQAPVPAATHRGAFRLGFSETGGNVQRQLLNAALEFDYIKGKNRVEFDAAALQAQNREKIIDEQYDAALIDLYQVSRRHSVYGKVSLYTNEYRGFKIQQKTGVGHIYTIYESPGHKLSSRIGMQSRFSRVTGNRSTDYNDGLLYFVLAGLQGQVPIVKNVVGRTKVDLEYDLQRAQNYTFSSNSSIIMTVNTWLNVSVNHRYLYAGLPVTGRRALDTVFDTTIGIRF